MSEPTSNPDLSAVEHALAGLSPSAGRLNRDALLFAAGRRSVRRGWGWPTATLASTLAAAALAGILVLRPGPGIEHVEVRVPVAPIQTTVPPPEQPSTPLNEPSPASTGPERPESNDLTIRYQVEHWSETNPPPLAFQATGDKPPAAIDDSLDLPPDFRTDPWLQRSKAMLTPGGAL